jgi:hypothetical protein
MSESISGGSKMRCFAAEVQRLLQQQPDMVSRYERMQPRCPEVPETKEVFSGSSA